MERAESPGKEMRTFQLMTHGEDSTKQTDQQVLFRIGWLLFPDKDFDPREYQEQAEENDDPVVLHQRRTQRDKNRAKNDRSEYPVEQHAVLVLAGDAEVRKHHHEDEDVINRK